MSSRIERFDKIKQRHAKRMIRFMKSHNRTSRGEFGGPLVSSPTWPLPPGDKQQPLKLTQAERQRQRGPWPASALPFFIIIPAESRVPPVLQFLPAFFPPGQTSNHQSNAAKLDLHHRRRRLVGRKPGRISGDQRRHWASSLSHFLYGYYHDNDPAHRHPQETEVFRLDDPLDADPPGSWA